MLRADALQIVWMDISFFFLLFPAPFQLTNPVYDSVLCQLYSLCKGGSNAENSEFIKIKIE